MYNFWLKTKFKAFYVILIVQPKVRTTPFNWGYKEEPNEVFFLKINICPSPITRDPEQFIWIRH